MSPWNFVTRIGATILTLSVLLVLPNSLEAQKTIGVSRIGWLEVCGPGPRRPHFDIFRAHLAKLGHVEGKNLIIEQRFADCKYERIAGLRMSSCRFQSMFCSPWARERRE